MNDADLLWVDPHDPNIKIKKKENSVGVFNANELIAYLNIEPFYRKPSVSKINQTLVKERYRQQGFMRLLLSFFVYKFGPICSDEAQTHEAQVMWKGLIQQPGGLKIVLWNVDTGEKIPAKGVVPELIWNDEVSTLLLIESIDISQFSRSFTSIFEVADSFPHRHRWGRHLGKIWLNP